MRINSSLLGLNNDELLDKYDKAVDNKKDLLASEISDEIDYRIHAGTMKASRDIDWLIDTGDVENFSWDE